MSADLRRLLLIDDDRIFRMGMRSWIDQCEGLELFAEAETSEEVLRILRDHASNQPIAEVIDLIMLDLGINDRLTGLELCQQLKSLYPASPILLLCRPLNPELVTRALQLGVEGYCPKGIATDELRIAIREVAAGNSYGSDFSNADLYEDFINSSIHISSELPSEPMSVIEIIRHNFYLSGLRNIDQALNAAKINLENSLGNEQRDRFNQILIEGQIRELQAARWLVSNIWGVKKRPKFAFLFNSQANPQASPQNNGNYGNFDKFSDRNPQAEQGKSIDVIKPLVNVANDSGANILAVQTSLWDRTVSKLQSDLSNLSKIPLEIDILKDERKRELLYITLRQVEQSLADLRFSPMQSSQLKDRIPAILRDIWQATVINFFGKHYVINLYGDRTYAKGADRPQENSVIDRFSLQEQHINVVDYLLNDAEIVQIEFLNKIPQVDNLFSHLLFATELVINNSSAALGTVEAMQRSEQILDHLIIHVANGVIQPLLNHFADVEQIKQNFYRYNLLSTREIERFRNELSWKYRLENYITNPQLIFESRHILFVLANSGIKRTSIYAPRNQELQQLEGIQLAVTLALELQDAIAPRLKSAISFLGSGFVYVLTNIIGRGIGLIGRGVMQGIGNAWQESRPKR